MERKYFAVAITAREWFERALEGGIDTLQFPPDRKPNLSKLNEGDPILILSHKEGKFLGELRFKEARFLSYEEFDREFRERAYEVTKAHFPSPGQNCWVMVFDEITKYENEVDKDKTIPFPITGLNPLTNKHWDKREKIKSLGGISRVIKPRERDITKPRERDIIKPRERDLHEDAFKNIHEDACKKLEELGDFFGWFSKKGYNDRNMPIDVVWKEREDFPKIHKAFEVQHKGNILVALSHLQHASDWGRDTNLFIVITDERDKEKARRLLESEPNLAGTFHRIRDQTEVLTYEKLTELYEVIKEDKTLIKKLFIK